MVHGSEGLDVTLAVTSLAQVILNPDCRTVRGFEALIEREWLQGGHPFWSRTSKGPFNDSVATKSKTYAPTFILFLDCLWQVVNFRLQISTTCDKPLTTDNSNFLLQKASV